MHLWGAAVHGAASNVEDFGGPEEDVRGEGAEAPRGGGQRADRPHGEAGDHLRVIDLYQSCPWLVTLLQDTQQTSGQAGEQCSLGVGTDTPALIPHGCHPGGNPGANLKSTPHRCHPILVAFVWELTEETIDLPLGCLQGGKVLAGTKMAGKPQQL